MVVIHEGYSDTAERIYPDLINAFFDDRRVMLPADGSSEWLGDLSWDGFSSAHMTVNHYHSGN